MEPLRLLPGSCSSPVSRRARKLKKLPKTKICPDEAGKAPEALGNSDWGSVGRGRLCDFSPRRAKEKNALRARLRRENYKDGRRFSTGSAFATLEPSRPRSTRRSPSPR